MKITVNDVLEAIAERIISSDAKMRAIPRSLIREVCEEKFGLNTFAEIDAEIEKDYEEINVYFALFDRMKEKSKEYGYKMRKVPLPADMNEGLPYDFEYIFTPIKSNSK